MNTCQITPAMYQIIAGTFDSDDAITISETPSISEATGRQDFIIAHKDIFNQFDYVTIRVVRGDEVDDGMPIHELKPRTWMPKHHPLNENWKGYYRVKAFNSNGATVTCVCKDSQMALRLGYNWMKMLGYSVCILNEHDNELFDSDLDDIIIDDEGNCKAVYLMGAR